MLSKKTRNGGEDSPPMVLIEVVQLVVYKNWRLHVLGYGKSDCTYISRPIHLQMTEPGLISQPRTSAGMGDEKPNGK